MEMFLELLKSGWNFFVNPKKSFLYSLLVVFLPLSMFPFLRLWLGIDPVFQQHESFFCAVIIYALVFLCYRWLEDKSEIKTAKRLGDEQQRTRENILLGLLPNETALLKSMLEQNSSAAWLWVKDEACLGLLAKGVIRCVTEGQEPRNMEIPQSSYREPHQAFIVVPEMLSTITDLTVARLGSEHKRPVI